MFNKLIALTFLFILTSCAHMMRSGKFVKLTSKHQDITSTAKSFKVSEDLLRRHNPGKRFAPGHWVFIPTKLGLYNAIEQYNNPMYERLATGEFIWPVPSSKRISSKFGPRRGKHHDGLDIAAPRGSHIVSVKDGVVIYSGQKLSGYGKMVIVRHANNVFTVYAHASKLYSRRGDKVHQGQVIAKVGSTGRSSGPHLHFEVRVGDNPQNPLHYLKLRNIASR